jgi:glucose/arabinose dehydrogenase
MALLSAFFAVASGQFLDRPLFVALLLVGGVAVAVFLWLMPAASRTAGLSGTPAEHDRETSGGGGFFSAFVTALILVSMGAGLVLGRFGSPYLGFDPLLSARVASDALLATPSSEPSSELLAALGQVEQRCDAVNETLPLEVTTVTLGELFGDAKSAYLRAQFQAPVSIESVPSLGLVVAESSRGAEGEFFSRFYALDDGQGLDASAVQLAELRGAAVLDLLWVEELGTLFWSYLDQTEEGVLIAVAANRVENRKFDIEAARAIFESPRVAAVNIVQHGGRLTFVPGKGLLVTVGDLSFVASRLGEQIWGNEHSEQVGTDTGFGATYLVDPKTLESRQFTTGHRNPQGLVFDAETGIIWSSEHGPKGGEELNQLEEGLDYGWFDSTLGSPYDGFDLLREDSEFRDEYLEKVGLGGLDRWCADPGGEFQAPYALLATESVAPSQLAILPTGFLGDPASPRRLLLGTLGNESLWVADIVGDNLDNWKRLSIGERIRDIVVTPSGGIVLGFDSGRLILIAAEL